MKKERLDLLVVEYGLARSRNRAQRLIRAGEVRVDGQIADKPGTRYPVDAEVTVDERPPFVGRGGEKLEAALQRFPVDVAGRIAADVGASTGGFTDCLLQRGAEKVYAIDVGYGQLAWTLRQNPQVIVMERTNARYLKRLPEPVSLIVSDVSFISLKLIYQAAVHWFAEQGDVVSLIKPQFEAGPQHVGKGGVVRDPAVRRACIHRIARLCREAGCRVLGTVPSSLPGPKGNVEELISLLTPVEAGSPGTSS
jgi:23S rRNA (cytidine1920-2'-O)/16S rRNA (cytidine1409-2'-O)-methyltransferase